MPAEGNDDGLILDGQNGRSGISWSGGEIGDGTAPLPLGDGLLIDAVAPGQGPQPRLTMLYRSTDRLCRCGAPVKNLAREKTAPSKSGTKHLACDNCPWCGGMLSLLPPEMVGAQADPRGL